LGYEISESKVYKTIKTQRQKSKIIIRPDKNKILNKLLEKNILMYRNDIIPYSVRNSNKHLKNVIEKRKRGGQLTKWTLSQTFKVLHYASCVGEDAQKIIDYFNSKIYGLYSYYKYCDQFYRLGQIFSILKYSCLKTLANKYKCGTVAQLYKKFGYQLEKIVNRGVAKINTTKVSILKRRKINESKKIVYMRIY
jgi:DNA-directed RNA polymerase beta' subunit